MNIQHITEAAMMNNKIAEDLSPKWSWNFPMYIFPINDPTASNNKDANPLVFICPSVSLVFYKSDAE